MANQQKVRQIKEMNEQQWLAIEGVTAIGIGKVNNQIGIIISVIRNTKTIRQSIPKNIQGVPIAIQETGEFKAQ